MILLDFHCATCDEYFDDLVARGTTTAPCPGCGSDSEKVMSAPRIGLYNNPEAKSAALKKRSHEHTMKELKKEPERHGFKAADSARWNLRGGK